MLTIHVWPKRLKAFLLTHPLYKSPSGHYTASSKWNRLFAYFTSENPYRPIKPGIRLISGVKNWGYSKVSRKPVFQGPAGVLSNRNMVDYAAVQSDECPNRTARPERPFPDGPAAARLFGVQRSNPPGQHSPRRVSSKGSTVV